MNVGAGFVNRAVVPNYCFVDNAVAPVIVQSGAKSKTGSSATSRSVAHWTSLVAVQLGRLTNCTTRSSRLWARGMTERWS